MPQHLCGGSDTDMLVNFESMSSLCTEMVVCFFPVIGSVVVRSVRVNLRLDRIRVVILTMEPSCSTVRDPVHAADRGGLLVLGGRVLADFVGVRGRHEA